MKESKNVTIGDNPFSKAYPRVEAPAVVLPETEREFDYESLFPFVNKPSRYIGGEWNSARKPEAFRRGAVSLCLCFPDLYETGFANMGVEILYRVANRRGDAFAERAYAPDEDLAQLLRRKGWPLFSLETRTPLNRFDIVGFSLPYELCYTNILDMLDLAGIPLRAALRDERHPLVIGGGPCSVNPEPLAEFFDAIALGDGEDLLGEAIELVRDFKRLGGKRSDLLLQLAKVPGLYVPSLYDVSYHEDGRVREVAPRFPGVPARVPYRVAGLSQPREDNFSFPVAPVVPFVQTVHDRLNVEIQRGCPWRCRFCQAGFTYHAYRERTKDELVEIVEQGLRNTGYDAVTLAGLSAADHREIVGLLQTLSEKLTPQRIAIGLPSTRADRFTLALAEILQTVRRQSLTFAPEAGSERLRRVIRKELQESEIRETLRLAARHGWKSVKLYFMYGLPGETREDLEGIVQVVRQSRKENPGLSLTITLSPFVPKPHTPFQWHPQDRHETHLEKLNFLRKNLPAQIRAHGLEQIVLEGVLSRGDRRCGRALESAWRLGARFDEWSERFRFDLWKQVFEREGLAPEFFCHRPRAEDEAFPWDHLQGGPDRRALWNDYQTALRQAGEPLPEQPHLKPRPEVPALSPASTAKVQELLDKTVQRLRFKISRRGTVRFLSHLEQIEMLRRAVRRAGLPVAYTSGFHPQMKCAFGPAVSVGYESECEYFDADLTARVEVEQARRSLAAALPEGFALEDVSRIPLFFPSLEALLNRVEYEVEVPERLLRGREAKEWDGEPAQFLERPDLAIEKVKKGNGGRPEVVRIPLKPLLLRLEWAENRSEFGGKGGRTLRLVCRFGPGKNAKPEKVAALFLDCREEEARALRIRRRAFGIEKPDGSVVEP